MKKLTLVLLISVAMLSCGCKSTGTPAPTATASPTPPSEATAVSTVASETPEPAEMPVATATLMPTSTPKAGETPTEQMPGGASSSPVVPSTSVDINALVEALTSGDEVARTAALDQLAGLGPEETAAAIPLLTQALAEGGADVDAIIAEALGSIGPEAYGAVLPLIETLEMGDAQVSPDIAQALSSITGEDFGTDAQKWREWWEQQQEALPSPGEAPISSGPLDFEAPTRLDAWDKAAGSSYTATIVIHITGGAPPFGVYHDLDKSVTMMRDFAVEFSAGGCQLVHTITVESADGQQVAHEYFISSPWCD
jgi:hypothetical protein